jgi:hypothetical protein
MTEAVRELKAAAEAGNREALEMVRVLESYDRKG